MDFSINYENWVNFLSKNLSPDNMVSNLPTVVILYGCNFYKWKHSLSKPYDFAFSNLMKVVTKKLMLESRACFGYHFNNEIILVLYSHNPTTPIYANGNKQQIISRLSSLASAIFNKKQKNFLPLINHVSFFEAKIFQTPNLHDVCSIIMWKEQSASFKSLRLLESTFYPKILNDGDTTNKTSNPENLTSQKDFCSKSLSFEELKLKIFNEKHVNWDDFDMNIKRGTFFQSLRIQNKKNKKNESVNINSSNDNNNNRSFVYIVVEKKIGYLMNIANKVEVIFYKKAPLYM